MKIPFTKAHGAKNDFLLTWRQDAPEGDQPEIARAICERHTGIGADGWMLVTPPTDAEADGAIQLYNSDGSAAEISGNGTRCAAALLVKHGHAAGVVRIRTGAGLKHLRLLERSDLEVRVRDEYGPRRDHGRALRAAAFDAAARRHDALGGQSAVRRAGGRFRFRLARHGRRNRAPPALSESHQRVVRAPGGRAHHRRPVFRARRGGDHEFGNGVDRGGGGGDRARDGTIAGARANTRGTMEMRQEGDMYLTGPAELVAEGQFFLR